VHALHGGKIEDALRDWQTVVEASLEQVRKSCGSLPGWLQAFSEQLFKPVKADWRAQLRRFLTDKAKMGTTFSKPNRRRHSPSFILPAQGGIGGGHIAILTDTSGSMGDEEMNKALGATSEILLEFPIDVEVTIFQCDTRLIAEATRKFTPADFPLTVPHEWMGRGGTYLSPAVDEIGQLPDRFKILVIVTDMQWGYRMCPNPGIPTVWITTYGKPTDIPFGELVQMDEE
jgi:predicted metal-dependent peptidase